MGTPPLDGEALVAAARDIATTAHTGQVDQAGNDYIAHPARVAAALHTPQQQAAGWLHDVLEDTDVTADDLADAGIPDDVIAAVEAVTHHRGEPEDDYLNRIAAAGPLAVATKLADMADNSDGGRLALIDDDAKRDRLTAKYARRTTRLRELAAGRTT
jgi:(p)ppGpp synthase/HD superfamily hydrolase